MITAALRQSERPDKKNRDRVDNGRKEKMTKRSNGRVKRRAKDVQF
jgi:hypothetical protein